MTSEADTLNLTVQAIRDFQVCELFYEYRYKEDEHEVVLGRELMAQRFENTLKKVASFFFYKKQAGMVPSYNALLNRWEKLWFPKDMTAYDLAVEQHEVSHGNIASYSNVAAAALERFHNDFAEDDAEPILIGEEYLIPLGDGIRLEGDIDIVLRKGNRYQVIELSGRQKRPTASALFLDFAALKIAFDHRNETPRQVEYSLYDLASGKTGFVSVEQPKKADVDALLYWAAEVKNTETFVPRRGFTAYCRGCPFDSQCARWERWPSNEV